MQLFMKGYPNALSSQKLHEADASMLSMNYLHPLFSLYMKLFAGNYKKHRLSCHN